VVDNVFQVDSSFLLSGPDGVFDRVEHHGRRHGGGHPPAKYPARVGVDDEGDIGETCGQR
jgi:hypothetical protein